MLKLCKVLGPVIISLSLTSPVLANPYTDAVANPARSEADRERDISSKPAAVLDFFGVQPGMTVLDLFSGGGYYSEVLAYTVGPNGQVISHTNKVYESSAGEETEKRFSDERLSNVRRLHSEFDNLQLKPASLDMILIVLAYHDIYYVADYWPKVDRDSFVKQLRASLKPGGVLAIVDHAAIVGSGISAVQDLHRIDEVFAKGDIERAGFMFDSASELLRNGEDDRSLGVFDEAIRRKTDRFVYRFIKP